MKVLVRTEHFQRLIHLASKFGGALNYSNSQLELQRDQVILRVKMEIDTRWATFKIRSFNAEGVDAVHIFGGDLHALIGQRFEGGMIQLYLTNKELVVSSVGKKVALGRFPQESDFWPQMDSIELRSKVNLDRFESAINTMKFNSSVFENTLDGRLIRIQVLEEMMKFWTNDRHSLGMVTIQDFSTEKFELLVPLQIIKSVIPYLFKDFLFGGKRGQLHFFQSGIVETDIIVKFVIDKGAIRPVSVETLENALAKDAVVGSILFNASDILPLLNDLKCFVGKSYRNSKLNLSTKSARSMIKFSIDTEPNTQRMSGVASSSCDFQYVISFFLFRNLIRKLDGKVEVTVFENRLFLSDQYERHFVMPTLTN